MEKDAAYATLSIFREIVSFVFHLISMLSLVGHLDFSIDKKNLFSQSICRLLFNLTAMIGIEDLEPQPYQNSTLSIFETEFSM